MTARNLACCPLYTIDRGDSSDRNDQQQQKKIIVNILEGKSCVVVGLGTGNGGR